MFDFELGRRPLPEPPVSKHVVEEDVGVSEERPERPERRKSKARRRRNAFSIMDRPRPRVTRSVSPKKRGEIKEVRVEEVDEEGWEIFRMSP